MCSDMNSGGENERWKKLCSWRACGLCKSPRPVRWRNGTERRSVGRLSACVHTPWAHECGIQPRSSAQWPKMVSAGVNVWLSIRFDHCRVSS